MTAPALRPLSPVHLERAAAIEATAPEAWTREQLEEELNSPTGRLYGLWAGDTLVGVAVFQLILDESSLHTFTVDPVCRRHGYGEALLRGALERLKEEGALSCFLEARCRNTPAVSLYKKLGFEQVGLRKRFYHNPEDDGLLMRLEMA